MLLLKFVFGSFPGLRPGLLPLFLAGEIDLCLFCDFLGVLLFEEELNNFLTTEVEIPKRDFLRGGFLPLGGGVLGSALDNLSMLRNLSSSAPGNKRPPDLFDRDILLLTDAGDPFDRDLALFTDAGDLLFGLTVAQLDDALFGLTVAQLDVELFLEFRGEDFPFPLLAIYIIIYYLLLLFLFYKFSNRGMGEIGFF